MVEHVVPPFLIIIGMGDRIEFGRILGNAGDHGAFRKVELAHILIKITFGRRLHT